MNVVADATQEHGPGLGTFGYDDEGVAAQCTPIITNGLFTGYLSSRETAHTIGENRSGGTLRAEEMEPAADDSHDEHQSAAGAKSR